MKIFKKIGVLLAGVFIVSCINFSIAIDGASSLHPRNPGTDDQEIPDFNPYVDGTGVEQNSSIGQGSNIFSNKLEGIIRVPQPNDYDTSLKYILSLIQIAINRFLGILAFVALVYMLYNGFLVLTSGSDSKNADKGKKGISTAAIAIAGIGLSWLIISAIIWLINNVAAN